MTSGVYEVRRVQATPGSPDLWGVFERYGTAQLGDAFYHTELEALVARNRANHLARVGRSDIKLKEISSFLPPNVSVSDTLTGDHLDENDSHLHPRKGGLT